MITPSSKLLETVGMFKKTQGSRTAVVNFVAKTAEQLAKIENAMVKSVNTVVENQELKFQPTDVAFNKRPKAAANALMHSIPGHHHTPAKAA